jgi:hypothetical protein
VALWLVADFEAITYQDTTKFNKSETLKPALQRQLTIACVVRSLFFLNWYKKYL